MKPEIREADLAQPEDAAGLVAVLDAYARDPLGGGAPLADEVRERLAPGLRDHPTTLVLLARLGDETVGAAVCFRGFSPFRARPLLNVHDLAVLPAFRGQGIGRALLTAVARRARELGCCKLPLEVQDDNALALALYRDFGFSDFRIGDSGPTRFLDKEIRTPETRR